MQLEHFRKPCFLCGGSMCHDMLISWYFVPTVTLGCHIPWAHSSHAPELNTSGAIFRYLVKNVSTFRISCFCSITTFFLESTSLFSQWWPGHSALWFYFLCTALSIFLPFSWFSLQNSTFKKIFTIILNCLLFKKIFCIWTSIVCVRVVGMFASVYFCSVLLELRWQVHGVISPHSPSHRFWGSNSDWQACTAFEYLVMSIKRIFISYKIIPNNRLLYRNF